MLIRRSCASFVIASCKSTSQSVDDSSLMFSLYSRTVPPKELALSSNLSSSRFRDWLDIFSGFLSQTSSWNNAPNLSYSELFCSSAPFIAAVDCDCEVDKTHSFKRALRWQRFSCFRCSMSADASNGVIIRMNNSKLSTLQFNWVFRGVNWVKEWVSWWVTLKVPPRFTHRSIRLTCIDISDLFTFQAL